MLEGRAPREVLTIVTRSRCCTRAQGPRPWERLPIRERWGPEGEELVWGSGGRFKGGEQDSDSGLEEKQQLMGQKDWPRTDLLWRKETPATLWQ